MKRTSGWVWFFIVLAGLVVGGFLGELLGGYDVLSWLNYAKEFGINTNSPMAFDFYIFHLTFGLSVRISIASVIGVLISMVMYKLLAR
ncbi:MAG: DUF4321 domain-containing protein [Clostridia bacterium]|nr:DUF4321 domain-containing protein [Clostridia bacterium]